MKHKHYDVIVAWAAGAKIQFRRPNYIWEDWENQHTPGFSEDFEYRIKPEPRQMWVRPYNRTNEPWTHPAVAMAHEKNRLGLPPKNEWVGPAVKVWEEK